MSTRTMLKSKIHRARVTDCNIDYEGSVTIDNDLLKAADILPYERVEILNVHNGARFSTYALEGMPGSGDVCLNGAAARKFLPNDLVIIVSYATMDFEEARTFKPSIAFPDAKNKLVKGKKPR